MHNNPENPNPNHSRQNMASDKLENEFNNSDQEEDAKITEKNNDDLDEHEKWQDAVGPSDVGDLVEDQSTQNEQLSFYGRIKEKTTNKLKSFFFEKVLPLIIVPFMLLLILQAASPRGRT